MRGGAGHNIQVTHRRCFLLVLFCLVSAMTWGQSPKQLTEGWTPYEKGFVALPGQGKSSGDALFCENTKPDEARGGLYTLNLNQTVATAFVISAWSKSSEVNGSADDGYALYLDLTYTDGDHLWGSLSSFSSGTHDWQEKKVRIVPSKPVKVASVYVLLRRHIGKAWFSNVTYSELGGKNSFDFQPIAAPIVLKSGWFVRDVAHNSPLIPVADLAKIGLHPVSSSTADGESLIVTDSKGNDRALTLYYCEKVDVVGGYWWNNIRSSVKVTDVECGTLTSISSGANGLASAYPFAVVTNQTIGRMLAVRPTIGPRPVRFFYNPASKLFCAAFDVGLSAKNKFYPSQGIAEVFHRKVDPHWGFRDGAQKYYAKFPASFQNRMSKQGIWIPFTDPSKISHAEDFGIAVHEGDNSVQSDANAGIFSFRYTEPMTWWMNMEASIPRTYKAALEVLEKNRHSSDKQIRKQAEAVINSGTIGEDGLYNVSFQNQPWANGAVWILNPNPGLARPDRAPVQADVVFDLAEASKRYQSTLLSGEYLDSLEAHSEVLDYRPESIKACSLGLSFDSSSFKPVVPQAFSTYEIANEMSTWLHGKGKFLMANTTPVTYFAYMSLIDCAGIEVNWLSGGAWTPDSDDVFNYRRTMSYHKPYMLLQNTDFSKFGSKEVSLYFKKCVFYGVYPSFFSADAASNPYWENPALYNRDRELFKTIIPLIRILGAEGWEPVTNAHTSDPSIFVERYGVRTWTVFNDGTAPKAYTVTIDSPSKVSFMQDLLSGAPLQVKQVNGKTEISDTLEPGDCRVIRLGAQ